jgi:hypothetical protein
LLKLSHREAELIRVFQRAVPNRYELLNVRLI